MAENQRQDQRGGEQRGGKVDLNRASKEELMRLDGIGDQTAERIIRHREENGEMRSVEDLNRIEGIGESTLENLRNQISFGGGGGGSSQSGKGNR